MNAQSILDFNANYIDHPDYDDRKIRREIYSFRLQDKHLKKSKPIKIDGHISRFCFDNPVIKTQAAICLIRKYNLYKKRISRIQTLLASCDDKRLIKLGHEYIKEATEIKHTLINSNLRLYFLATKKLYLEHEEHIGVGYETLNKAVDGFDSSLGFALSTYLTNSIYKNVKRVVFPEQRVRPFSIDEHQMDLGYDDSGAQITSDFAEEVEILKSHLAILPVQEKDIICKYFGIDVERQTLEEIGRDFNLSRERIRQIKEQGIRRLRKLLSSKRNLKPQCI